MGEVALDRLREAWEREWPRASAGSDAERTAMLDTYAELNATAQLLAVTDEDDDLLDLHDDLGRSMTARTVRRILPSAGPLEHVAPVLAVPGEKTLRVERSRPDWHLNGTVRTVPWAPDVDLLAVFAVDEGDNDVLALIAADTTRVELTPSAGRRDAMDVRFDDVSLPTVTHCPGEPARLADGLTVLAMAEAVRASSRSVERPHDHPELRLCRAALGAAARSLTSPSSVRRQHDVSAAALLVLPTCARLITAARVDLDVAWHRDRLVALV